MVRADIQELAALTPTQKVTIPPLTKRPPKGLRVDAFTCDVPICAVISAAAEQAATALGWHFKNIAVPAFTPEAAKAAWDTVLQDKPNVVLGFAPAPYQDSLAQMKQAHAAGATIIMQGIPYPPLGGSSPMTAVRGGGADLAYEGKVEALQAIANAKAGPTVVFLDDPTQQALPPEAQSVQKTVQAAGGKAYVLNVSLASTTYPSQLVTFLVSHPSVKYALIPYDDFMTGIPQALKAAGLSSKVKLIGSAATSATAPLVANGQIFADSVKESAMQGWSQIDVAARVSVGDPIWGGLNAAGIYGNLTSANGGEFGDFNTWPNLQSAFEKAWHVG